MMLVLRLDPIPFPLSTPWPDWATFPGVTVEVYPMPETAFIRVVALVDGRVVTFTDPTPDECTRLGDLARCRDLGLDDLADRVESAIKLQLAMKAWP
jgi:hypothetical protein